MESSERESNIKKTLSNRSARSLSIVALLALLPVVLFVVGRSTWGVVAAVNVLLIFGCLYLLTAPTESEDHAADAPAEDEARESVA